MGSQTTEIFIMSRLGGWACHAPLILQWLKRSEAFTLIIRETELVYGMKEEFFPKHASGLYYGRFSSKNIEKSIESGLSTDSATENLLKALKACQDWKFQSPSNNGRQIGRNGDHNVLKKTI